MTQRPDGDRPSDAAMAMYYVYNLLAMVIRYGAIVLVFRYAYLSIDSLAGKETLAKFFVEILVNRIRTHWLWSGLTLSAIIWAIAEGIVRRQTIKRLSRRIQELERRLDPNRSSSGIQPTGDTNPEDKP